MATRRVEDPNSQPKRSRPATTSQGRENQLISLAQDAAEKMLRSDNPPAQVVTAYLRLGSSREKLEQEKMAHEIHLLQIRAETLASQKRTEELYSEAMDAFRGYLGRPPVAGEEDYDDA